MADVASQHDFILSAFDTEQWCPVLQARFAVRDLAALAAILGDEAKDDPELQGNTFWTRSH